MLNILKLIWLALCRRALVSLATLLVSHALLSPEIAAHLIGFSSKVADWTGAILLTAVSVYWSVIRSKAIEWRARLDAVAHHIVQQAMLHPEIRQNITTAALSLGGKAVSPLPIDPDAKTAPVPAETVVSCRCGDPTVPGKIALPLLLLGLLLLGGCANTTTTTFSRDKDGKISISSPKDVDVQGVDVKLADGTTLHADHYTSKVVPALTTAQGNREAGNIVAGGNAVGVVGQKVVEGIATSSGIGAVGSLSTTAAGIAAAVASKK